MSSFFTKVFNSKKKCTNATKKMKTPHTCVGKKRFQAVPLTVSKGSPKKMGNPSGKGKKRKRNAMKVSIRKRKNNRSAKRRKYYILSPSKTQRSFYTRRKKRGIKRSELSEVKRTLETIPTLTNSFKKLKLSNSSTSFLNSNSNNSLGVRKKRTRRRKRQRKRRNSRRKRR